VTVWQSDHPEDFVGPQGIRMGCGWVQDTPAGFAIVDHEQEAYAVLPESSQRALRLEDSRARRQQGEEDAAAEERAMARAFRWRSLGYEPTSWAERVAIMSRQTDAADRREESRIRSAVLRGELELQPTPAPGLRSQRFEMERQQRERVEARTPEQVRLDELQAEVTQLKSKLHALGG
jgi:hypothetical protein